MEEKTHIKVKSIIYTILIIIVLIVGSNVISKYNYNDFTKSVRENGKTSFSRDKDVKYSEIKSYKVENKEYNDAMFSKKINVKKDTPYKITCMVKTENVENENRIYSGGAQISIIDTTECSKSLTGTNDWTEMTFMFNSKNRETIDIGFRLGGFEENSKGTAWFSDFKIEEGSLDVSKEWKMACFIIQNLDVNITLNGKRTNVKTTMSSEDIYDIETNMRRLPDTFKNLSNGQMTVKYDMFYIKEPLKNISYEEENEFYIAPNDVEYLIKKYVEQDEYDYIYIATRLGNINNKEVLVHDWIGLGGMDYYGIGYSNIRLPDTSNSYMYKYNTKVNIFPEEVFIHEFLHTLERNEKEYGNTDLGNLHDFEQYGYKTEKLIGLKKWYEAYMKNTIKNQNGTRAGLTENSYKSKPIHESDFKYAYELNEFKEPSNIMESIRNFIDKIKVMLKKQ